MSKNFLNIAEIAQDRNLDANGIIEILLPYQKKWIADNNPVKYGIKSRRIGWSWGTACGKALKASATNGGNVFYQGLEKDMTRQFIEDAANWSKAFNLVVSEVYEEQEIFRDGDEEKSIQVFKIVYNSGHRIEAMVSNPRAIRSKQGDIVLDECSFMDDFPGCLKAARAMLIWGSKIEMFSTLNGVEEPFYLLDQEVLKGKFNYSRHYCNFDDAIAQGLYKQICYVTGKNWSLKAQEEWRQSIIDDSGEDADEELFCIPNESGGKYIPSILVERAMDDTIPVFNLKLKDDFPLQDVEARTSQIKDWIAEIGILKKLSELHPHYRTSFGFDFGRSGDLSYLIVFQELPNLVRKAAFAVELRNVPFTEQEQILFYICDRLPRFIGGACDSRGNGQSIAEKAADRYGRWRVEQVMLSQPWYSENMPKYKAALEDRKVILPASSDLLSDHRSIEVQRGIPKPVDTKNKDTKGLQRHSDGAIAAALGWYASCFDNEAAQPAIGSFVFDNWELGAA